MVRFVTAASSKPLMGTGSSAMTKLVGFWTRSRTASRSRAYVARSTIRTHSISRLAVGLPTYPSAIAGPVVREQFSQGCGWAQLFPPRQEPARLFAENDHIQQLDRCLTDEPVPMDPRVRGALVLLFGMIVSRIIQLTKGRRDRGRRGHLPFVDGYRLALPPRLAVLVSQVSDQDEPRWTLGRLGIPAPWLFLGRSPARPAVKVLFGVRLGVGWPCCLVGMFN